MMSVLKTREAQIKRWPSERHPSEEIDFIRERGEDGNHDHIKNVLLDI
jgi:hypothetical protein